MKRGPLISAIVACVALSAVVMAFMSSASAYVTVAQARESSGTRQHLAGDLVPGSVFHDMATRSLKFDLKDASGDRITVEHRGEMPSNINEATQVVAIGGIKNGVFQSTKLLVKCPTKYKEERSRTASAR